METPAAPRLHHYNELALRVKVSAKILTLSPATQAFNSSHDAAYFPFFDCQCVSRYGFVERRRQSEAVNNLGFDNRYTHLDDWPPNGLGKFS